MTRPTTDPLRPADTDTDTDDMCPNCVTPWKCNGPHLVESTPYMRRLLADNSRGCFAGLALGLCLSGLALGVAVLCLAVVAVIATPRSVPLPETDARLTGAPPTWPLATRSSVTNGSSAVGSDAPYPESSRWRSSGAPTSAAAVPAVIPMLPTLTSGVASWFDARGDQAAVPWWQPGQTPVWASVSTFSGGRTRSVTVLVTGFCQCWVGTPRERVMDLSKGAFAQLADPSVGLIRVSIEVPAQGPPLPPLPATDADGSTP